jgi:hypothetical protein
MIRVGNTSKWALALASCSVAAILAVGCPAKAQTCPATPPLHSIFIYNDTPRYIFAELEAGLTGKPTAPGSDIWMQAICKVPDSQTETLTYPQTITNRFYINPTTGIPPGGSVEIQIPLFTQLAANVDPTAQNQYAEWWQGENVEIYESATATPPTAYAQDYGGQLRPKQKTLLSNAANPVWPKCTDQNNEPCPLAFFTDQDGNLPKFDPSQLIEATLGAKQTPPVKNDSPKYSLDVSNADFDVSYVNIAFGGAALGPYQNDQVGYVGTPMLPVGNTMNPGFRLLLQKFQALNNWPTFLSTTMDEKGQPVTTAIPKLPSPLELMARLTGANPPADLTPVPDPSNWPNSLWPAVQTLKDNWVKYSGACQHTQNGDTFCDAVLDIKQLFELNYANYKTLFSAGKCNGTPVAETENGTIGHVYGWTPWTEAEGKTGTGCVADLNLLQNTPDESGTPIYSQNDFALYNKVKLEFDKLQYGKYADASYVFDPWVEFIHGGDPGAGQLGIPNAYAYSVDDAVGNIQAEAKGFIIDIGSLKHLENQSPAGPPINITFGYDPNSTLKFLTYGVCGNLASRQKPVDPLNPTFIINANDPKNCPVYFTDNNSPPRTYTFTVTQPPASFALIPTKEVRASPSLAVWSNGNNNPTQYNTTSIIDCSKNADSASRHWCCTLLAKGGNGTFAYSTPEVPPQVHSGVANYAVANAAVASNYNQGLPTCNFGQ